MRLKGSKRSAFSITRLILSSLENLNRFVSTMTSSWRHAQDTALSQVVANSKHQYVLGKFKALNSAFNSQCPLNQHSWWGPVVNQHSHLGPTTSAGLECGARWGGMRSPQLSPRASRLQKASRHTPAFRVRVYRFTALNEAFQNSCLSKT